MDQADLVPSDPVGHLTDASPGTPENEARGSFSPVGTDAALAWLRQLRDKRQCERSIWPARCERCWW
jgi:hypothetical protein